MSVFFFVIRVFLFIIQIKIVSLHFIAFRVEKMRKEIGKWFMDVAKYVATAVLISSFLGGFQQKWIMYVAGSLTVVLSAGIGLLFIKNDKTN